MAPTNKIMSLTGFTYEKNNFAALVDFDEKNQSYHKMMKFFQNCKLSKAMFEAPKLYFKVIEAIWESAVFDSVNATITFTFQEKRNDSDVVNMLNSINYALPTSNLSKIQRRCKVKEWSFFFDAILKVFSGKISNYDAVTFSMLDISHMLLSDSYYNLGSLILFELGAKLGNKVQNKRFLEDLNRMNHNNEVQLVYLPIINAAQEEQVTQVTSSTVPSYAPSISLISSATMETGTVQQPPTQVATSKISKSKSKKPTSGASQKAPVVKNHQTT
ncbi:hypothetical protein POM88_049490 [Heracleum sosnowskyi]|uniref:Uncharacterized protein n=1 Tax=Heracleum sosnowskyi TaxID=360622 RepID=A0AAD8GXW9_9APIA|nr:hypothetical protein POM88_049490 [Heracleum sosnowskyi]